MRASFNRPAAIFLLIGYAALVFARGIMPALSRIDSDFPNYLTAATIVVEGSNTGRLYDDSWFGEQARRYGIASSAIFSPFPPPTALLYIPLTHLEPLTALRVLTGISLLCLVCAVVLLARVLSWGVIESALFILASGIAIQSCLRLGQPYILVATLCILAYYAYRRGWPLLAGGCFGVFVPIKYYPVVMLACYAIRRQWRVALGGVLAILGVTLTSIAVLGWKIHQEFLLSVLGRHLTARNGLPLSARVQSLDTLFGRYFIADAADNPRPLLAAPALQIAGVAVAKAAILITATVSLVALARRKGSLPIAPAIGLLGIVALLMAPGTATYHFVLLWLPLGLLSNYLCRECGPEAGYLVIGLYALIGLIPYGFFARFEDHGWLTVLAFPRLVLLLLLFIGSVYLLARVPPLTTATTGPHGTLE